MRLTPDDLFAKLDALGIAHETQHHPAVFTVEESKRLRGVLPGAHVKNLFLKDKKSRLFLISAVEDTRIDLKKVHELIGGSGRVSFGSGDLLLEVLGELLGEGRNIQEDGAGLGESGQIREGGDDRRFLAEALLASHGQDAGDDLATDGELDLSSGHGASAPRS